MKRVGILGLWLLAGISQAESTIERGEYLTDMLSCGYCHTPGGMLGQPDYDRHLAGSDIGLAYTPFGTPDRPAVIFPGNLTSDKSSGLGKWTDEEITTMIQTGVDPDGRQHIPVMPWPNYAMLKKQDVEAIVAYLRTLPSVRSETPENVKEGEVSEHGWIRFGIYHFDPDGLVDELGILDIRR